MSFSFNEPSSLSISIPVSTSDGGTGSTSHTANAFLYGNGSGSILNLSPVANSLVSYDNSSVPQAITTLPTGIQDNITRLGTLVSVATPIGSSLIESTLSGKTLINPDVTGVGSSIGGASNLYAVNGTGLITRDISTGSNKIRINEGGTNSNTALSGSSVMISNGTSIVQGATGTATTVLHGNLAYSAVSLTADVSGTLPIARGGTNLTSTPANGQLLIGNGTGYTLANLIAGANIQVIESSGFISIANSMADPKYKRSYNLLANGNATTMSWVGGAAPTITGAVTRTVATTNFFSSIRRIGLATSTAVGNTVGILHNTLVFFRGDAVNKGGFVSSFRWGIKTAQTAVRYFVGFYSNVSLLPNLDPSAVANIMGFAVDSADSNIQFMHNDSSGTATRIDMGSLFPARTASVDFYQTEIICVPGSTDVQYIITNLTTLDQVSGIVSSNIPTNTTLLTPVVCANNNAGGVIAEIDLSQIYIETNY